MPKEVPGRVIKHQRVTDAFKKILDHNWVKKEWKEYAMEKYNLPQSTAEKDWEAAKQKIKEKFSKSRSYVWEKHHSRIFDVYEKAMKEGKLDIALKALQDIAKLGGLNEAEKKDITTDGKPITINKMKDES